MRSYDDAYLVDTFDPFNLTTKITLPYILVTALNQLNESYEAEDKNLDWKKHVVSCLHDVR